jgi:diguanylate cyclase (GGDEF)-like protein|uniref:Diguanylate cyclase n=1 Tax=candidate division WOR-3 bacterium TaxID=2052148 RepID=A0A7V3RGL0_UNCW3
MKVLVYQPKETDRKALIQYLKRFNLELILNDKLSNLLPAIKKNDIDIAIIHINARKVIKALDEMNIGIPIILTVPEDGRIKYEDLIIPDTIGILKPPFKLKNLRKLINKAIKRREQYLNNLNTVESLKKKVKEMEVLNEIAQAINSSLEPKEILKIIMEKTADLIRAEAWSILLVDRNREELVFEAAAGAAGEKLIGMRININQGIAGWVARTGKSLIVEDVTKDPRFYDGVDKKTKFVTKSILCVPMKSCDETIGVVEVINKIGGEPFTKDDLEIFENLVQHVTVAIRNIQIYRKLEETSITDDLTKLYNTRYCNQVLDELIKQRIATKAKISLIFFDVDFFKLVDDNYGHLVGSETLRLIGERARSVIREKDIAVRYGGDEYIIILPDTDKPTAAIIAERIRRTIEEKPFPAMDGKYFNVTVTLGVATFPDDALTRDELIGQADRAMYRGKMSGRNKVVV